MEKRYMNEKNALIDDAVIEIEDHGILTAWLYLDYGNSAQGFGGFALDSSNKEFNINAAAKFIRRCLEIGGVRDWKDLKGKTIRVKADNGGIEAIGHIIKNDWFNPKEEFDKMRKDI
jgi:hypothetical protein